jgi:epoxyqueuosine reductase QueG
LVGMAEAAGLGRVGKNGLLLNSRYGPRLILGGLITSADLQATGEADRDWQGCPDDCFICQERCPVRAIEKKGRVDRIACIRHSMKSPLFSHLMKAGGIPLEEVESLNQVTGVDDHSTYECLACVSSCPLA